MAVTDDPRVLVEAYKHGDADAFDEIVHQHYRGLFAHALRRLGSPHAAEDAVQETLVRAYRGLPGFNGDYRLQGWLHKILTNVCHDEGARRQREHRTFDRLVGTDMLHDEPPADDRLDRLDVSRRELVDALAALPESYRQALVLRYVDELSFHEVAEATGVTEGNARLRVHRGRAALKRALGASVAALGWLLPVLRRAEKEAVAQVAGRGDVATAATALVANPSTTKVAEAGFTLGDKFPSFAQLFGVAATMVVPAAVPVVSGHVADRLARPAAVAAPLEVAGSGDTGAAADPDGTAQTGSGDRASTPTGTSSPAAASGGTAAGSDGSTATAGGGSGDTSTTPTSTGTEEVAGDGVAAPTPTTSDGSGGSVTPVAESQRRAAAITADDLVAVQDWRTELSGTMTMAVGDDDVTGTLYATFESGNRGQYQSSARSNGTATDDGDYESAAAPREFTGEIVLGLEGGRTLRVVLAGTLEDTDDGATTIAGTYRLLDGCGSELATGDAAGLMRIEEAPVASSLQLDLAEAATELARLTSSESCEK